MKKIGFLVNPIAGMGGRVGLKGTDGMVEEAIRKGSVPTAVDRAKAAMKEVEVHAEIITCSSDMGENCLEQNFEVVYRASENTSAYDTKNACKEFLRREIDLIVFCGGDGTARDVYNIIGKKVPVIGVPAGVKMYSSVFAITPTAANKIILKFLQNNSSIIETEIMDVDEGAFRKGVMKIKLYGYAMTPYEKILVQKGKEIFISMSESIQKKEIASFLSPLLGKGTYILCGGSTTEKIAENVGIKKSLLGVDVIKDGKLIVRDACENDILGHLDGNNARIVVSPIGRQGFIFGRGNQQISPKVIKKVGIDNIIIVATPHKLSQTPYLFVDTGDAKLDKKLEGWKSVIVGFAMAERKMVLSA
ncbi:MAG: ATP-NAD kinase family protein [Candidatus Thermoplasmatota archaeon]|nr:ATP-NAD kinase family protein [Candidatus Thermoplasmatota archaeon]